MPSSARSELELIREIERLEGEVARGRDVFGELAYVPTARQADFHEAAEWDVLYGGAAGGGKTRALLAEGLRACVRFPGIAVLAIRESYPQLAESFIAELARMHYASALGATYTKSDHNLTFANGSVLRFRYCDGLEDARLRLGSEIQLLLIDEATQQDPTAIDFLASRLRSSNPAIPVRGIRMASNPGGIGHGWARDRYVVGTDYGARAYEDVVDGHSTGHFVRFIPARYTDNPHVPDYESVLNAIKDPRLRAAYRDGSWDTFEGQVFTEWNRSRHVVAPFTIPAGWRKVAGIDWGYTAPWAVLWMAQDADRRVWVYRELYDTQVGEAEQARRILEAEGNLAPDAQTRLRVYPEDVQRWIDPSTAAKKGEALPIAATYAANGCVVGMAANNRITGWQRVHSFLAEGPACEHHRAQGWATCPMLHVFDTCSNLTRTLPSLPADKHNPEDVDTDSEDHAADALRYALMALHQPYLGREALPHEPQTYDQRIWKQLQDKRRRAQRGDGSMTGILGRY